MWDICRKRVACKPEEETQYIDKQRGISVVLDAEGGSGDLKGDIKASGLDGCEDDGTIPFELYLKQAEYFLSKGIYLKSLNRLNIALRLEPSSISIAHYSCNQRRSPFPPMHK